MLERFIPGKQEQKETPSEKLANTLVFFVGDTEPDKNMESTRFKPADEALKYIVFHALNGEAADQGIALTDSVASEDLIRKYFDKWLPERNFTAKYIKDKSKKIDFVEKITKNPVNGVVALLSIGGEGAEIASQLKDRGVSSKTINLAEESAKESAKQIAESATSSARNAKKTLSMFLRGIFNHRDLPNVRVIKFSPSHA